MHLLDEELYLALDDDTHVTWVHLATCDACQRRLADTRLYEARVEATLGALDHRAATRPSASEVMLVARRRALSRARRRRAIIGGIVTALSASAAAAAISIPQLRVLAQRIFAPASVNKQDDSTASTHSEPRDRVAERGAGIAFLPSSTTVIDFSVKQSLGTVRFLLTSGAEVRIEHSGDVHAYRRTPKGVTIDNALSQASYVVQIPRDAPNVIVRIGARIVLRMGRGRFTTIATRDGADAYTLEFSAVTGTGE